MTPVSGLSRNDIVEFGSGVIGLAVKLGVPLRAMSVAWRLCDQNKNDKVGTIALTFEPMHDH